MKSSLCLLACCGVFLLAPSLKAGTEVDDKTAVATTEKTLEETPLDIFKLEQGYVFESDLNHGGSFGKQDLIQLELEYGHRFLITGKYYAHVGFAYDRYDFGSTAAPVPNHSRPWPEFSGLITCTAKMSAPFFRSGQASISRTILASPHSTPRLR